MCVPECRLSAFGKIIKTLTGCEASGSVWSGSVRIRTERDNLFGSRSANSPLERCQESSEEPTPMSPAPQHMDANVTPSQSEDSCVRAYGQTAGMSALHRTGEQSRSRSSPLESAVYMPKVTTEKQRTCLNSNSCFFFSLPLKSSPVHKQYYTRTHTHTSRQSTLPIHHAVG